MRIQVILDSLFARSGSASIGGGKKGEFRDWTSYSSIHNLFAGSGENDIKNRYTMRTYVCYLEIIVGYVVLSCTVQNVGFLSFVWCHVCFVALKIDEIVGKKIKQPQR